MSRFAAACSRGIGWPSTRMSPRSWLHHAHQHADRRRLAGAVGADQAHDLSGVEAQGEVRQLEEAVGLFDAGERDDGLGHGSFSPSCSGVAAAATRRSSGVNPSTRRCWRPRRGARRVPGRAASR